MNCNCCELISVLAQQMVGVGRGRNAVFATVAAVATELAVPRALPLHLLCQRRTCHAVRCAHHCTAWISGQTGIACCARCCCLVSNDHSCSIVARQLQDVLVAISYAAIGVAALCMALVCFNTHRALVGLIESSLSLSSGLSRVEIVSRQQLARTLAFNVRCKFDSCNSHCILQIKLLAAVAFLNGACILIFAFWPYFRAKIGYL